MYGFKEIDCTELQTLLGDAQNGVRLIDVRNPGEVARGALPSSENLPLHTLPARLPDLSREEMLVLYCQSGGRSAQACAFLAAQGFDNVCNLRGGIVAWMQRGNPVN